MTVALYRFNIFTEEFTGQSPMLYPNIKHILTQMYFLTQTLEDGTPISREFDFIGKLETINDDWRTVGTILGFSHLDIQLQVRAFQKRKKMTKGY